MSEKQKVRFAVIGSTGYAGAKVVKDAITRVSNCELAAVQSLDSVAAKAQADSFSVPWFGGAERMLDEVPCDAVYIATPQNVHLDNVQMAVARGLHVMCEKPLARDAAEAAKMVRLCEEAGVTFGTAFNCRFNSLHVKAREMIAQGVIGEVISARCQYGQDYPPDPKAFRQKRELAGGGSMVDMGNHAMDLVEFVTNKRLTRVMAVATNVIHQYPVEDVCAALLEFEDAGFAFVDTYYCSDLNVLRNDLEINGTRGILYTVDTLRGMVTGGELIHKTKDFTRQYAFDGRDMYLEEFEAFAKAILEGSQPPCTGYDGLHSQELLDAIYQSSQTGRKVDVGRR